MSLIVNLAIYAVKDQLGKRIFNENDSLSDNSRGKKSPDWLTRTWDWAVGFFRKGFDYLMSNFCSVIMGAVQTLYQYDWAASDDMIIADIEATNKSFGQQLGRMGAAGLVRNAKIGMPKMGKMKWPTLDPVVIATIEEENKEELNATLNGAMTAMKSGLLRNFMNLTYVSGRFLLGLSPKQPYTEPWSFAKAVDDAAEWAEKNIPIVGSAIKGFIEQLEDDLFEVGYLVTSGIQTSYAMARAAINDAKGKERIIKYYPDSSDKSNFTFISGSTEDIRNAVSTEMAVASGIGTKSVGMVVQTTIDTGVKAARNERLVTAYFYSGVGGATTLPDGKRAMKKEINIPNLKPTVTWDKLKATLKPFTGGNFKVVCHLNDGHQLQGFFNTEGEGKSYLTNIATNLCNGDPVKFTTIQPNDNAKFRSEIAKFTVSTATIRIAKETLDEKQKTIIDTNGKWWKVKAFKLTLRLLTKPDGIDEKILNPWGAVG